MYRVYCGIVQPERQATLSRQISAISVNSLFPRQESYELSSINAQWNRKRLSSTSSLVSVSSNSSCSSCGTDMSDVPKRCFHKRVTFSLNPSLTIHEHSDNEDVFEEPVSITNAEVINNFPSDF